ncbi:MAG TPA: beta-ketoacyl synthase N-terminal-like domain-containing protein [Candidatus Binatus sp.]|nr:beta-ketoacyl synthase N-terminal-like domain-containing protein [Candidatus Binatus sp.]
MTKRKVCVIGVGMTKFERCDRDFTDLCKDAITDALGAAGVGPDKFEQAFAGYVNGMSCQGQRALYYLGLGGIPVYNVHSYCSTGSSALHLGYQAIASGMNECVLAFGFEKMEKGPLDSQLPGLKEHYDEAAKKRPPAAAVMFGDGGRHHMELYGTTKEQFAKVSVKNHRHSVNNPRSQYREACTLDEVFASRMVYDPLTILQCCPTSDGAAAAILCSEDFAKQHGHSRPVKIVAQALRTDLVEDFAGGALGLIGVGMSRRAAAAVYEESGIGPDEVDVIELHDCFSTNELVTYESLQLCKPGEGGRLIDENQTTYGGKWVVNPSGGLLSKGHPLGATGLAQCAELVWQLNGAAEKRQVEGARIGLQHNVGLGGACVVTMYRKD